MRKIVAVRWVDSMRTPDWESVASVIGTDKGAEEIISVGILIEENKDRIIISNSLDRQRYIDHVCLSLTIPRSAILNMTTLKLPKKGWDLGK